MDARLFSKVTGGNERIEGYVLDSAFWRRNDHPRRFTWRRDVHAYRGRACVKPRHGSNIYCSSLKSSLCIKFAMDYSFSSSFMQNIPRSNVCTYKWKDNDSSWLYAEQSSTRVNRSLLDRDLVSCGFDKSRIASRSGEPELKADISFWILGVVCCVWKDDWWTWLDCAENCGSKTCCTSNWVLVGCALKRESCRPTGCRLKHGSHRGSIACILNCGS